MSMQEDMEGRKQSPATTNHTNRAIRQTSNQSMFLLTIALFLLEPVILTQKLQPILTTIRLLVIQEHSPQTHTQPLLTRLHYTVQTHTLQTITLFLLLIITLVATPLRPLICTKHRSRRLLTYHRPQQPNSIHPHIVSARTQLLY